IPDFVASPFKVRVWIPLTPDVPTPALTLVSALISDGDNRNCPSCAWTKEVAAAIRKIVVNRIFINVLRYLACMLLHIYQTWSSHTLLLSPGLRAAPWVFFLSIVRISLFDFCVSPS